MLRYLPVVLLLACKPAEPAPADGGAPTDTDEPTDTEAPEPDDLSDLLEPILTDRDVPALAAAVLDATDLLAIGAVGLRSTEAEREVKDDDPWHLGSDTKAMTATLAATWVEEGALTWESTVPELFPELTVDPAWDDVTLEQLLHHRSGMFGDANDHLPWWNAMWQPGAPRDQRADFVAEVFAIPPDYPEGDFLYSNFGYIAVGAALEHLADDTWEDLLTARVFDPLGMASCGFGPPATPGQVDAPWGHYRTPGGFDAIDPGELAADNPAALGPAGTAHCSLRDWGRFGGEHLAGARGEGTLLTEATYERLHTPTGTYAAGWGVGEDAAYGGRWLAHDGSNTMFYASIIVGLDADRVWLVTTNLADPSAVDAVYDVMAELPSR